MVGKTVGRQLVTTPYVQCSHSICIWSTGDRQVWIQMLPYQNPCMYSYTPYSLCLFTHIHVLICMVTLGQFCFGSAAGDGSEPKVKKSLIWQILPMTFGETFCQVIDD